METPGAYSGPLQANTVLCSFNTTQPSSYILLSLSPAVAKLKSTEGYLISISIRQPCSVFSIPSFHRLTF